MGQEIEPIKNVKINTKKNQKMWKISSIIHQKMWNFLTSDSNSSILWHVKEFMQKNGTAYIATALNFGDEEIIKITFRDSRETVLNQDNIN